MPARDDILALCESYLAALNTQDPDRIIEHFAADATQQEPVGTPPNVGREEIRAFFEGHKGTPITVTRFGPVNVVGDRAVFQALVLVERPDGVARMTTTDVVRVDENCKFAEMLAFPDRQADPADAPGARLALDG